MIASDGAIKSKMVIQYQSKLQHFLHFRHTIIKYNQIRKSTAATHSESLRGRVVSVKPSHLSLNRIIAEHVIHLIKQNAQADTARLENTIRELAETLAEPKTLLTAITQITAQQFLANNKMIFTEIGRLHQCLSPITMTHETIHHKASAYQANACRVRF